MILQILALCVLALAVYIGIWPYIKCLRVRKLIGNNTRMIFFPLGGYIAKSMVSYGKTRDLLDHLPKNKKPQEKFLVSNILTSPWIILEQPQLAKQYLLNHGLFYKQNVALFSDIYFSKSIAISQGDSWNRQKRIFSKAFSYQFFTHLTPKIQVIAAKHFSKVEPNKPMNVYSVPFSIASEVISQTFFSRNINEVKVRGVGLIQRLRQCLKFCADATPTIPFLIRVLLLGKDSTKWGSFLIKQQKQVLEDYKTIQGIISAEIDMREKTLKEDPSKAIDFLDQYVLEYISEKNQETKAIDKDEIVQQFITLFTAGSDTTSTLAGMCLYNLARYPDSFKKIEDIVKNMNEDLTLEQIAQHKDLSNFIIETSRMYPPTFDLFPRYNKEEVELGGIKFPPNTYFGLGIKTIMNDPNNFPQPDTFNPQRWSEENSKDIKHYSYLAFSSGPRSCVGERLAMLQLKIIIIEFVRLFTIQENRQLSFRMVIDTVYKMANEQMVIPTKRHQVLKK